MLFAHVDYGLPKISGSLGIVSNEPDLLRFGDIVRQRREELGLRQDELRHRGGPSTTTLTKVENGVDEPSDLTLRRLDAGLRWAPGSAKIALRGGEPTSQRTLADGLRPPSGAPLLPTASGPASSPYQTSLNLIEHYLGEAYQAADMGHLARALATIDALVGVLRSEVEVDLAARRSSDRTNPA